MQEGHLADLLGQLRADVDVELDLLHAAVAAVSPVDGRCQGRNSDGYLPLIEEIIDSNGSITSNWRALRTFLRVQEATMNRLARVAARQPRRLSAVHLLGSQRLLPIVDEKLRLFVSWWQRMHSRKQKLIAISLKAVVCPDHGTKQCARFVWEVCKWPRWHGFDWVFICWKIDGTGMWMKQFATKREALAFYWQSPHSLSKASEPGGLSVCL